MLYPRITRPTGITAHITATLIDNIFSNHFDCHIRSGLCFTDICDHLPVFSILFDNNIGQTKTKGNTLTIRDKNPRNMQKFKE